MKSLASFWVKRKPPPNPREARGRLGATKNCFDSAILSRLVKIGLRLRILTCLPRLKPKGMPSHQRTWNRFGESRFRPFSLRDPSGSMRIGGVPCRKQAWPCAPLKPPKKHDSHGACKAPEENWSPRNPNCRFDVCFCESIPGLM